VLAKHFRRQLLRKMTRQGSKTEMDRKAGDAVVLHGPFQGELQTQIINPAALCASYLVRRV
jgi:hypothetical protein